MQSLIEVPAHDAPSLGLPTIQPGDLADMSLFAIATWYIVRHLLHLNSQTEEKSWRLLVSLVEALQESNRQCAEGNQIIMTQMGVVMERLQDIENALEVGCE